MVKYKTFRKKPRTVPKILGEGALWAQKFYKTTIIRKSMGDTLVKFQTFRKKLNSAENEREDPLDNFGIL